MITWMNSQILTNSPWIWISLIFWNWVNSVKIREFSPVIIFAIFNQKWKFSNFSEFSLNLSVHLLMELNPLTRYVESPFAVQSIFIFEVVNEFMAEIRGLTFILNAKNQNHFIFSPIIRCNHHQDWGRFVNPCYMVSKNTLKFNMKS